MSLEGVLDRHLEQLEGPLKGEVEVEEVHAAVACLFEVAKVVHSRISTTDGLMPVLEIACQGCIGLLDVLRRVEEVVMEGRHLHEETVDVVWEGVVVDVHLEQASIEQSLMVSRRALVAKEAQEVVLERLRAGLEAVAGLLLLRSPGVLWQRRLVEL